MLKTREEIEKEFESIIEIMEKEAEFDSHISKTSIRNLLKKIHQIRQDDLEEIKGLISINSKNVFVRGWKDSNEEEELETMCRYQDLLDKLNNLNK